MTNKSVQFVLSGTYSHCIPVISQIMIGWHNHLKIDFKKAQIVLSYKGWTLEYRMFFHRSIDTLNHVAFDRFQRPSKKLAMVGALWRSPLRISF